MNPQPPYLLENCPKKAATVHLCVFLISLPLHSFSLTFSINLLPLTCLPSPSVHKGRKNPQPPSPPQELPKWVSDGEFVLVLICSHSFPSFFTDLFSINLIPETCTLSPSIHIGNRSHWPPFTPQEFPTGGSEGEFVFVFYLLPLLSWKCQHRVVSADPPNVMSSLTCGHFGKILGMSAQHVIKFCCPNHARWHDMSSSAGMLAVSFGHTEKIASLAENCIVLVYCSVCKSQKQYKMH